MCCVADFELPRTQESIISLICTMEPSLGSLSGNNIAKFRSSLSLIFLSLGCMFYTLQYHTALRSFPSPLPSSQTSGVVRLRRDVCFIEVHIITCTIVIWINLNKACWVDFWKYTVVLDWPGKRIKETFKSRFFVFFFFLWPHGEQLKEWCEMVPFIRWQIILDCHVNTITGIAWVLLSWALCSVHLFQ